LDRFAEGFKGKEGAERTVPRTMTMIEEETHPAVVELDGHLSKRILKSAVNDYLAYTPGRENRDLSEAWLFTDFEESETDRMIHSQEGFVSLFTVCELLDVDHEKLRMMIKCKEDQGKRRMLFKEFDVMLYSCRK